MKPSDQACVRDLYLQAARDQLDEQFRRGRGMDSRAATVAAIASTLAAVRRYFCRLLVGLSAGPHDLVPELGAVAPADIRHDLAYRLPGKAITR